MVLAAKKGVADFAIRRLAVSNGTTIAVLTTELLHTVETVELALHANTCTAEIVTAPPALNYAIVNHAVAALCAPSIVVIVAIVAPHIADATPAIKTNILVAALTLETFARPHLGIAF